MSDRVTLGVFLFGALVGFAFGDWLVRRSTDRHL